MDNSNRLVVLDGSNFFWRSYHGNSEHHLEYSGRPTWAVHGTIMSLAYAIRDLRPSHVLVVFDWGSSSFRKEIYNEYKAGRVVPQDGDGELASNQMAATQELLALFNVPIYKEHHVEADDVVAKVCEKFHFINEIYLITGDKDWRQLVSKNVKIIHPSLGQKEKEIWDLERVINHYSLPPDRLHELWALSGDKTDNIPGVPGIGEKRALKLLQKYSSLQNLLLSNEEKIQENLAAVQISDRLVSLRPDLSEFDMTLEELCLLPVGPLDDIRAKLVHASLDDLGLKKIKQRWQEGTLWVNRGKRLADFK